MLSSLLEVTKKDYKTAQAKALEYDQLMLLLEAADQLEREAGGRFRHLGRREALFVCFTCALRATELCQLRWSADNLRLGVLSVHDSKTAAGIRKVPMPSIAWQALREWKLRSPRSRPDDFVFPTANGKPRDKDSLTRRIVKPAYYRAQELAKQREENPLPAKLSSHSGRRTAVTFWIEAGADPHWVQDIVGHEDSRMTMDTYREKRNLPKDERVVELMSRPDHQAARRAG